MALDFQQIREQVLALGESAPLRERERRAKRDLALTLLENKAQDFAALNQRIDLILENYDSTLRCARPTDEALNLRVPAPAVSSPATILAADGSQIAPDRHAVVDYCLVNVGAIRMTSGAPAPPETTVRCQLFYDETMYTSAGGKITEALLGLRRDLRERELLVLLAKEATPPVITLTDGRMELWGAVDAGSATEFQQSLRAYIEALERLGRLGAISAAYVDKPGASLVVRLLEIAMLEELDLPEVRKRFPLRSVGDLDLFLALLAPGERSAVFALQSKSAAEYRGDLALHFFYLNVGRPGNPSLSRVEVPAWVAQNGEMLEILHAALIEQCRIMGNRPYPYLLHRAHEAAVVSREEKAQVEQMIAGELQRRGVPVGRASDKQAAKDLPGRTRYTG